MKYLLSYPDSYSEEYVTNFDQQAEFIYLVDYPVKIVYVKDMTIDFEDAINWGTIICIGADPLKKVFNQTGITKLSGTYETFTCKKGNCNVRVGCLLDPKITHAYPEKTQLVAKALMSLLTDDGVPAITKFHYPGHDYITLEDAQFILEEHELLVVDLETTSFNPISGRKD